MQGPDHRDGQLHRLGLRDQEFVLVSELEPNFALLVVRCHHQVARLEGLRFVDDFSDVARGRHRSPSVAEVRTIVPVRTVCYTQLRQLCTLRKE
jgi:hypothetical protein